MIKKSNVIIVTACIILAAFVFLSCVLQREQTPPVKAYIIDPAPPVELIGKTGRKRIPLTLDLYTIKGVFPLRTRKIYYKKSKISQNPYLYSRWEDAPTRMLTTKLLKSLGAAGIFKGVTLLYTRAQADLSLDAFLFDFTQHVTPDGSSFGVISITFQLIEKHTGKILGARSFEIREPAPTTDAEGAAKALNDASDVLCAQVITWLQETATTLPPKKR